MKVTKEDLSKLKEDAENPFVVNTFETVETRASAYLAIESIYQLRNNLRNSVIILILGIILGFLPSYVTENSKQKDEEKEIKNLQLQVSKLQDQLIRFDKYLSKKDYEQTSSKKK